jgi:hypothetical protein
MLLWHAWKTIVVEFGSKKIDANGMDIVSVIVNSD